jgi:hypothetical protein
MRRVGFLERQSQWKGRLDCRGPLWGPRNDELEVERMDFLRLRFAWQGLSSTFNCTRLASLDLQVARPEAVLSSA